MFSPSAISCSSAIVFDLRAEMSNGCSETNMENDERPVFHRVSRAVVFFRIEKGPGWWRTAPGRAVRSFGRGRKRQIIKGPNRGQESRD
jgi:hypothetical protein